MEAARRRELPAVPLSGDPILAAEVLKFLMQEEIKAAEEKGMKNHQDLMEQTRKRENLTPNA